MRWRAPTLRKNPSMEPPYVYFLFLPFFMQLQLLKILSPIIMASYLVRETDFQLIVIVHGNMGEAGGTTTLMKFVLLIEILIVSVLILEAIAQFSGQN